MNTKAKAKSIKNKFSSESSTSLPQINVDAAGIDIGAVNHWVSVPEDRDEESVRSFGCFTADLYALADWLEKCSIKTVQWNRRECTGFRCSKS